MADDTPGRKRAKALLKKNPNFYIEAGRRGGETTQKLHGPKVQNFRNPAFAKEAGLRGLKSQGKA